MPDFDAMMKRQQVLGDFGEFVLHSQDINQVLQEACRLVGEALSTGRAKILEIFHADRQLLVRAGVGWDPGIVGKIRLPLEEHSSETFAIEAGMPVISHDISKEERFQILPFLREAGVVALVNAPIFLPGGRVFGLLQVDATEPRDFHQHDVQFLRTYTTILGSVIDRLLLGRTLRSTEERFRLTVEQVRDYAIFLSDPQDRITDWLPGAEAVFGWTAAEVIGQSAAITFSPEDRESQQDRWEAETACRDGVVPNVRWHLHKSGRRIFVEGSTRALYDEDGALLGFLRLGQDVTERLMSEERLHEEKERFRLLVENMPQLVWRSGDEGNWTWASPQWLDYTGQSQEQTHGLGWLQAVHPDDREATMQAWHVARDQNGLDVEYRLRRASDGAYRWHRTRSVPLHDSSGSSRSEDRVLEWLGTSTDIDDLKRLQERQGVLVAELHHRTRNLLNVAQAIVMQTLGRQATPKPLIDRLVALGRVQSLIGQDREDEIGLEEVVRLELRSYGGDENGRVTVAGPLVLLPGERVQDLALVLHELTTNAVKHGALKEERGQLEVRWVVTQDGDRGPMLVLNWRESDVVMPADQSRHGYGRVLIERVLSRSTGSRTLFTLGADGVTCQIEMPLLSRSLGEMAPLRPCTV
ncbi:PAS domain S-box protein [Roseomonas haemaphysalidis]|uniref:histidine kinase n=1 Tax=Roseomonas haemaphysalidis TaxID=2768162 RepID=A0ABS3KJY6_9PROT|nr:PAS domain S-box protein [Roseomonas haemaphysalidis]MBO1077784.1 PAS domain S-box protein [Roseomonas haemaphysalidis]